MYSLVRIEVVSFWALQREISGRDGQDLMQKRCVGHGFLKDQICSQFKQFIRFFELRKSSGFGQREVDQEFHVVDVDLLVDAGPGAVVR